MPPMIRTADHSEAIAISDLIATAFEPLRPSIYLVPDDASRRGVLAGQFAILVEHALEIGHVDVIDDTTADTATPIAAAVWFDHTAVVPEPPDYAARLEKATGPWLDRFVHMDDRLNQHHPAEDHHFLLFLAVGPHHQGRGLGSALLDHHHTTALGGHPAYLDAASPASRDLYTRHGYQRRPPYEIADGARFWPMWRPGT